MFKWKPIVQWSLGIIVFVTSLGLGGAYAHLRPSLPEVDGELAVPGLQAPVEVIRDRWGVPHIYAQGERDLFFAQGYVHAQDRLWQMELGRRAARGTLAEVFGESALPADRLARSLGLARAAAAEWQGVDGEPRRLLEAYAQGVNAFLSAPGRRLPPEFDLLDLECEPWKPEDTLAWARVLAWTMDGDWQAELMQARLLLAVGPERTAELVPALAVAASDAHDLTAVSVPTLLEAAAEGWPWAGGGLGGSAWVVGGGRTESGAPILASAPQLPVQMPSPWYEMHLVGGRYDVIGTGFPGLPGLVLGRNRAIAWGLSGSTADGMDLYLERVRPGDPPRAEYQGDWEPLEVREETILVRGLEEPVLHTVCRTRHGPLVSDLETGASEQLALSWVGDGQPAALALNLLELNRATDWQSFQAALDGWAAPSAVVPFADVWGNVGYATAGAVPGRSDWDGSLPVPGWTGAYEWSTSATAQRLPRELRTASDTVIAGGGSVAPVDWPQRTWDGAEAATDAVRIAELIQQRSRLTLEDAQAIQCDDQGPAQPLLDLLLALPPEGWLQERTTPYLRDWDLRYDAESVGAGIYEVFYWRLVHNMLDDELGAELVDSYLDAYPGHRAAIEALAQDPDSPWFDDQRTPEREGRDDMVACSYADAIERLGRRFGDLPYEWNWGRVHHVTFEHLLGQQWPLNLLLNRGAMRAGGGPECADANGSSYGDRLAVGAVPYRLVVDLAGGGGVVGMNTTGQSGNALSAHYTDMIELWRQGSYHPLLYERPAILEAKEGVLSLSPAP